MARHTIDETTYEEFAAVALASPDGLVATYAPSVGMVGCSLTHAGDELLAQRNGLAGYAERGSTFGIPLLHPWANRLAGFSYEAADRRTELHRDSPRIRLDEHGLPIHGVVAAAPDWRVTQTAADDGQGARLSATLDFGADPDRLATFPFPHEVEMDVRLHGRTLSVETTLIPAGDIAVPISFGYHPYLQLPAVARADWRVELPVGRHLLLDDHSIPTGATEPADEPPGPLGDRTYDDGYADLSDPPVFALEGGGRRIELRFGRGYRFAQVFAPPGQDLICFEPMTAPTNALVSGWDLRTVEAGARFTAAFEIEVIDS